MVRGSKKQPSGNTRPVLRGKFRSESIDDDASKSSGKKAASGEELRRLVREACLGLFRKHFGIEWEPKFDTIVGTSRNPNNLEKQARKIWSDLHKTINRAVDFARTNPVGFGSTGQARNFLAWWVLQFLEPLTRQPIFVHSKEDPKHRPFPKVYDASRVRLVQKLETYNMFGLAPFEDGSPRLLDAREMAIVSLLCGTSDKPDLKETRDEHWAPGTRSMTVAKVLRAESDTMAALLATYGNNYNRFLAWDDALRQFGIEPAPHPARDEQGPVKEVLIPVRRGRLGDRAKHVLSRRK